MLKLNKEQNDCINDIINEMADKLLENPTVKDFKELIELLQECGYEGKKFIKIANGIEVDEKRDMRIYGATVEDLKNCEYIDEYKLKKGMPCCKKFFLSEFNKVVQKIVNTSSYCYSVEESEVIDDISELLRKYKKWNINIDASEDEVKKDTPMYKRETEKDDITNIGIGVDILMRDVLVNPTIKNIYLLNKTLDLLEAMKPKTKYSRDKNIIDLKKVLSVCMENFAENPNEENTNLIFKLKDLIKRFEDHANRTNYRNILNDTKKIKNITIFYDDDVECRVASMYEIKDIVDVWFKSREK